MTQRNDPCPCGSGKKYKRCCFRTDAAAIATDPLPILFPEDREEALAADRWEADVVALPRSGEEGDDERPAIALVTAGGAILYVGMWEVGVSEPSDVAQALEDALACGAADVGEWPEMVAVRSAVVADLLEPRLARRGCRVTVSSPLPSLDPAARLLLTGTFDEDVWPPISAPSTWAAWGLPEEMISDLFAACAAFYRATPWRGRDDAAPLFVEWRDGADPWLLAVLGGAGLGRGLGVYSDPSDYYGGDVDDDESMPFQNLSGWILSLTYATRNDFPRPMQREIAGSGWEVAATDAYPLLMPIFTPGGGVGRDLIRRLTAVLRAVASWAEALPDLPGATSLADGWEGEGLILWSDDENDEESAVRDFPPALDGIQEAIDSGEIQTLEDTQEWIGIRMEAYNATPQTDLSGLSPAQAQALLAGDWLGGGPLILAEDLGSDELGGVSMLINAQVLLRAAIDQDGLVTTKAGNLRRAFVTEMLDRMVWPDGYVNRVRDRKKLLNEEDVWSLHVLRVVLGLSGLLRVRKGRFKVTVVGRRLAVEEHAGALLAHLFRSYFREFNLAYGARDAAAPSIQSVVPLLLWRIGAEARSWVDAKALSEKILPDDLRNDPEDPPMVSDWGIDRCLRRVVEPLVPFGLLDERVVSGSDVSWWRRRVEVRVSPLFERLISFDWS